MMQLEQIINEISALDRESRQKLYLKTMDGFFKEMMGNQNFKDEAFKRMATYLNNMKELGVDVYAVMAEMAGGLSSNSEAA